MDDIENIIQLRKQYASKLYEFYNYAGQNLIAFPDGIAQTMEQAVLEETGYWEKWQNRIGKLERFNQEIHTLNSQKMSPQLTQTKLLEIAYLRSSFEKQSDDCKKHYLIVFSKIKQARQSAMNDIIYQLLALASKQTFLGGLQQEVSRTYPQLKIYCEQWKTKQIDILQNITYSIYEIEMLCQIISQELDNFDSQTLNDDHLQYFDKLKSMFFAEQCAKLSECMENFLTRFNITELLGKLKSEDSQSFKEEFAEILGNKGLGSVRSNIKMINNVNSTKKKVNIIYQTFKKLQLILQPELNKMQQKKNKLILLCTDASELGRLTTQKWVLATYPQIFTNIDGLITQRTDYLENISSD